MERKGQSHEDNMKLIQKLLHPEWGRPKQSPTWRAHDSWTHFRMLTPHKSAAGSKTPRTHVCLQTKPERLHFRVASQSGFHRNFLKFWGFYKRC